MSGTSTNPAVYVDAFNNSLEDVYIQGGTTQQDGILIGSRSPAANNVLFDVTGVGLNSVIHISSHTNQQSLINCPTQTSSQTNVCDVTVLGVTNSGSTATIKDDLTSTTLTDANLGMYVLGEQVQGAGTSIGYSRFTTSTSSNVATWIVGPNQPGTTTSCALGDLFSQTSGTGTITLWGCGIPNNGPPGVGQWYPIM